MPERLRGITTRRYINPLYLYLYLGVAPYLRSSTSLKANSPEVGNSLPQRRVELSCVGEVSMATQLNSTDLLRADWLYAATGSVALPIAGDS